MADPFTLGAATIGKIGLGATAGGGILSTVGSLLGADAKADAYAFQSAMALYNAQVRKQNADYERQMGEVGAQQLGMKQRFQMGQIITGQAASGTDVNFGSNVDVRDSQAKINWMDQSMVRSNAARRAYGEDQAARGEMVKAWQAQEAGENAVTEGYLNAGSSILGTASSVSGKWLQGRQVGVW